MKAPCFEPSIVAKQKVNQEEMLWGTYVGLAPNLFSLYGSGTLISVEAQTMTTVPLMAESQWKLQCMD